MEDFIYPAIIYLDGMPYAHLLEGDDFNGLFDTAVKELGGEVALMVWKPKYQIYIREKYSYTAPVNR